MSASMSRNGVSVLALLGLAACASLGGPSPRRVEPGVWGARGAELTVTSDGARLELGCAHGQVRGALELDDEGRFDEAGVYVRERPGPERPGQDPDSHPARFFGSVEGETLTLTVEPTDGVAGPGTFRLRLGARFRVIKCL